MSWPPSRPRRRRPAPWSTPRRNGPAAASDLLTAAREAGDLTTFLGAVEAAGLTDELSGDGPFTIFAPTDEAFAKLPAGKLADLMRPANRPLLVGLVKDHVVAGRMDSAHMISTRATNQSGGLLGIAVVGDVMEIDDAHVVRRDIAAANGVIHTIDAVLAPLADNRTEGANAPGESDIH